MRKLKRKATPIKRRAIVRRPKAPPVTAIVPRKEPPKEPLSPGSQLERVLIVGDLSQLSPDERIDYYRRICESLSLNALTVPFQYILFKQFDDGPEKLSLYATKNCAEQLRKIHGVSVIPPLRRTIDADRKIVMVEADLRDRHGKTDTATGAVSLRKWDKRNSQWSEMSNAEYCNAIMKCETKAKRRGTLSICGLSALDESELDTMTVLGGVSRDGRIYRYENPITPNEPPAQLEENARAHGHAKGSRKADQAEATLANTEELDRMLDTETDVDKLMKNCGLAKGVAEEIAKKNRKKRESQKAPGTAVPSSPTTPASAEPQLEVETVGPDEFIIRGDITAVYSMIEHYCQFRDGWWRCNLDALKQMQALTNQFKFKLNVLPAAGKKENPAPKPSGRKPASDAAPSGNLVLGTVVEANDGTTKHGKMMHITLRVNPTETMKIGVFNAHLFPYLQKGVRVEAYVETKGQYQNISGLKRVKMQNGQVIEFDDDGKTPALSTDREPGTPKR